MGANTLYVNITKQNIYIARASIPNYELETVTLPQLSG